MLHFVYNLFKFIYVLLILVLHHIAFYSFKAFSSIIIFVIKTLTWFVSKRIFRIAFYIASIYNITKVVNNFILISWIQIIGYYQ